MANQTGLLKARGHKKGQNRFWPVAAGQNGQVKAGCGSCTHGRKGRSWLSAGALQQGRTRLAAAAVLLAEWAEVG